MFGLPPRVPAGGIFGGPAPAPAIVAVPPPAPGIVGGPAPPAGMLGAPAESVLFQVQYDAETFRRKVASGVFGQPPLQPTNCGAATAWLLGLVSDREAAYMTRKHRGYSTPFWNAALDVRCPNYSHRLQVLPITREYVKSIGDGLRPGSATLVVSWPRQSRLGHWYVLGKRLEDNAFILFDAQMGYTDIGVDAILTRIDSFHPGLPRGALDIVIFTSVQKLGGQRPVVGLREVPVLDNPILQIPEDRLPMWGQIPLITLGDSPEGYLLPPPPRQGYVAPQLRFGIRSDPVPGGQWEAGAPIPVGQIEAELAAAAAAPPAAAPPAAAPPAAAPAPVQVTRLTDDLTTIVPGTIIQVHSIFPNVVTREAFYWQRASTQEPQSGYIVKNNDRTIYKIKILTLDNARQLIERRNEQFVALRFVMNNGTGAIATAYATFEATRDGGGRGTRRQLLKGGRVIGGGADTCVVEPYIPCDGFAPIPRITYVSRLVAPDSVDHLTEAAITQSFPILVRLRLLAVYSFACHLNRGDAPARTWDGKDDYGSRGVAAAWQREQTGQNPVHWNLITPKYLGTMYDLNTFQIAGYQDSEATRRRQLEALTTALVPACELVSDATNTWIIHTDLHMNNVGVNFVGNTMVACLADFGRVLRIENIKSVQSILQGIDAWAQIAYGPAPFGQRRSAVDVLNQFADPNGSGRYPQHPANVMAPIRDMYVGLTGPRAGEAGPGSQIFRRGINALRGWMVHSITNNPAVIEFDTSEALIKYLDDGRYLGFGRAIHRTRAEALGDLSHVIRPSPRADNAPGAIRDGRLHVAGTPGGDGMAVDGANEDDHARHAIQDFPLLAAFADRIAQRPGRVDIDNALRMVPRAALAAQAQQGQVQRVAAAPAAAQQRQVQRVAAAPAAVNYAELRDIIRTKLNEGLDENGDEEFIRVSSIQEAARGLDDARLLAIVDEVRRNQAREVAAIPRYQDGVGQPGIIGDLPAVQAAVLGYPGGVPQPPVAAMQGLPPRAPAMQGRPPLAPRRQGQPGIIGDLPAVQAAVRGYPGGVPLAPQPPAQGILANRVHYPEGIGAFNGVAPPGPPQPAPFGQVDEYGYGPNPFFGRRGGSTRRPSSLPTRRAGRSSSSRRKRYTRRQRALRTGKAGYHSTKTGRTV